MSFIFRAMYRFGFTPWDSGVSPPELKELIEGPNRRPPGKALDLGCGTGTNAIYMTQNGWDVTAVDFVPRAIQTAKAKAQAARVSPRLMVGDVTKLDELKVGAGYSLVFDLGCFHAIPQERRPAYVAGATKSAAPGADFLLWGFYRPPSRLMNTRVTKEEIEERFSDGWELLRAWGGEQPDRFAGQWYHMKRR
jgi:cyclopropane fatty-acyl-phospholipid synthase-like methyltransferase